jgi:peptidoglycan/LPS O-acetylase OafA/YrhL
VPEIVQGVPEDVGFGMKRTLVVALAVMAAAGLLAGLVHAVLVAVHLSEPAATTVYGLTSRRLWALLAGVLALVAVIVGGRALIRPASGRLGALAGLAMGLIAGVNGAFVLAVANGGPGSGNGVIGGAGALVLGVVAMALGGLALVRSRRAGAAAAP